ncbi:hypothetical protein LSH36_10g10036 [Paralvinella palmiformis]|uniref:Globin domain-containing protein n=1 Tax=Paralvinella palmiformis TaxID=53620 RepID=A0AAD9NID3_9ANNE|nr:hypothetical protein LSH36_10g10036 [Paralvinella palmiformis]
MGARWSNTALTPVDVAPVLAYKTSNSGTLSSKQKQLINESWKVVSRNMKEFGVEFFVRLFHKHAEYKNVFPAFRDENVEDLSTSIVLRAHATIVMQTIMASLKYLDDPEGLKRHLYRIVGIHHKSGVRKQHYQNMFDMMIEMLAEHNDSFGQLHYEAWYIVTNKLLVCIRQILDAIDAEYDT